MSKYDVFEIAGHQLVVVIQSDLLPVLDTTLVIPLRLLTQAPMRSAKLNPRFDIAGKPYLLIATMIAAVPTRSLRNRVASLKSEQDAIADAIDTVLYGF